MNKRKIITFMVIPILVIAALVYTYQIKTNATISSTNREEVAAEVPVKAEVEKTSAAPKSIIFQPDTDKQIVNPIAPVGTDQEGRMYVPDDISKVYWYKFGPTPGDKGNAIIAGHRDWGGKLGMFQYLETIEVGEKVAIIDTDNKKTVFKVVSKNSYPYKKFPNKLMDTTKGQQVTLISCTGVFIRSEESYANREVVILKKV
ncbi:class F sortase [Listeria booriae]|uniref:class F sortase n=1 Tax=Listeria booriae TaxID=1552123 RepID=UPI001624FCE4|nr:class F sortase [Listeria booriae]MBC2159788.1 class F sortase [Listeria booriae]MBC2170259.1 class F sortase [Listeria booriae]